jgi:hypothetical protein
MISCPLQGGIRACSRRKQQQQHNGHNLVGGVVTRKPGTVAGFKELFGYCLVGIQEAQINSMLQGPGRLQG